MNVKNICVGLILFCCLVLTGCRESQEQLVPSGKTVKVGVITALSGINQKRGNNALIGVKVALHADPYLLNGDKVELVVADDQDHPELIVGTARRLITEDQVSALVVLSGSATTLALARVADELQTPVLAVVSSHSEVTSNNWVSQVIFDDKRQGLVSALYVLDEMLVDTAAVFKDLDDPHSVQLAGRFVEKFEEAGGDVKVIELSGENYDYEKLLSGIEQRYSEFFYLPVSSQRVIQINDVVKERRVKPWMLVSDGVASGIYLEAKDNFRDFNDMLAVDVYPKKMDDNEYKKKMSTIFEKEFNAEKTTFAALGCEAMSLLQIAMGKCGDSSDKQCINNHLRGDHEFYGFAGYMRILEDGRIERPVFINRINNGEMEGLVKIN